MSMHELPKAYSPRDHEDDIYKKWETSGVFNPDTAEGEPYAIMMPPPNVTGVLHLGHALENSLMDIMARFQRMQGKKVLLLPGTDHSAVATQARVEDNLRKAGMENPRQELGREKLLEEIRAYAEASKSTILSQIRKMGTSADWSRLAYTFDEERSQIVNEVFKQMFEDGLIYRGYRVVNWSVAGQSTASADELEYAERQTTLYTFKYSKDFPIPIATTLPETKLGDTAVAVHPDDDRYKQYIGQVFTVDVGAKEPLEIHVIADENVEPSFGTGALGVTPAHATVDFDMYEKNPQIGIKHVVGLDGNMTELAGAEYAGLPYKDARKKFVQWLRDNDLLISEEDLTHNVALSDRFKDEIWPMPMEQWFINVNREIPGKGKTLKDLMREAVTTGLNGDETKRVTIVPEQFHRVYLQWIDNLHDWCISRQIWWGHRIPIWTRGEEVYCGTEAPEGEGWEQDPDTLDTWFSSGMWTFSTLGWPDNDDFTTFHPTAWIQMGYEIVRLWLARMVLFSAYLLDDIPFKDAYIHGILRAKDGRKFSKSLGNGIDPIEVIDTYGTDALRVSLVSGISPGNDARFYEEKVESAQHLVNKIWNISRFILMQVGEVRSVDAVQPKTLADHWILARFDALTREVTDQLNTYGFSAASESLREFTWSTFADWYLEVAKAEGNKEEILLYILERLLVLWHPFAPFVTEAIWEAFGTDTMLARHVWPEISGLAANDALDQFAKLQDVIVAIRNLRAEYRLAPKLRVEVALATPHAWLVQEVEVIKALARCETVEVAESVESTGQSATAVVGETTIRLSLEGLVDSDAEKQRLNKELEEATSYLASLTSKLENRGFVEGAPEEVVAGIREKHAETTARVEAIETHLKNLS